MSAQLAAPLTTLTLYTGPWYHTGEHKPLAFMVWHGSAVSPSLKILRKLLHSMPQCRHPLPMHLRLRPGSLYRPARQPGQLSGLWCVLCIRSIWAWDCSNSASKIPRNDQASVRHYPRGHSVRHGGNETRESSWAAQGCGDEGDQQPKAGWAGVYFVEIHRPHPPARHLSTSSSHLSICQASEVAQQGRQIVIRAGCRCVYAVLA